MAQKLWIGSFARTNVRMGSERSKKQGLGNDSGARGGREGRRARIGGRDFDSKSGQKSKGFRRDSPEGGRFNKGRREESGAYDYSKRPGGPARQRPAKYMSRNDRKSFYREAILAIDVGGTKTHAMLEVNGKVMGELRVGTPKRNSKLLIDAITTLAQRVGARDISAIGLCVPGFVEDGSVHGMPNLGISEKVAIGQEVSKRLGAPVVLENDAKAFAIAEYAGGAGKGANPLVCMTFGTGVGGGVIINGEMYTGARNMACEFGHVKVSETGAECGCGGAGCLETFCSGKAIERAYRERINSMPLEIGGNEPHLNVHIISQTATAKDILDNPDDKVAEEICKRAAWWAGRGAGNMANTFNPQKIVIGGSVAPYYLGKYGEDFREGFRSAAIEPVKNTPLELAKFENPSLEGALFLAKAYIKAQKESGFRKNR